jgi:hypothetical protein
MMRILIACAVTLLGTACDRKRDPPPPPAAPTAAAPSGALPAGGALPAASAAKPYRLSVDAPPQANVGKPAQFHILLAPAAGYHLNQEKEFPFEIAIKAVEVELKKPTLERADAQLYTAEQGRWDIDFTPRKAGPTEFTAKIYLAVCRDKDCIARRETLTWTTTAAAN